MGKSIAIIKSGKYIESLLNRAMAEGLFFSKEEALLCASVTGTKKMGTFIPSLRGLEQTIEVRRLAKQRLI